MRPAIVRWCAVFVVLIKQRIRLDSKVMSTIHDLVRETEESIRDNKDREQTLRSRIEMEIDVAKSNGRSNLTAEADARCEAMFKDIEQLKASRRRLNARLAEARKVEAEEAEIDRRMAKTYKLDRERGGYFADDGEQMPGSVLHPTRDNSRPAYDQVMRIGNEARTYDPGTDPSGSLFIADVVNDAIGRGRGGSSERLNRHMAEERVERPQFMERSSNGVGTTAFGGLVIPQYLVDQVAPSLTNLRPIANLATKHNLPADGMALNIPLVSTASSAAVQAAQLNPVSFTDMATTMLTVPVRTAAGQQILSRQAVERGTGIEDVVISDLMRQIATVIDTQLLTATGAAGNQGIIAIAQGTTYTDASPTADKLLPYLYQSESLLEKALIGRAVPDYVAMRSEHWNWITANVSTSHPWLSGQAAQQAGAIAVSRDYGAVRGVLPNGLKVVTDNNIPGTGVGPAILMLASGEIHVYEDSGAPVIIRAEQPSAASLGVLIVAYSYFAFCVERYTNAAGKVTGTGVALPAGY